MLERVLTDAVARVCAVAGMSTDALSYAFFGLPGYGEVHDHIAQLDAMPFRILGHDRYRCDNDMVSGWAGSLGLADGINVVSGTGSIAYGRRRSRSARVGGWGELFGDEGSGYWIGIRALRAYSQMQDGRIPHSRLANLLDSHLALPTALDVVGLVQQQWAGDRSRVASLAPVVAHAAQLGDDVAVSILTDAATELVRLVEAAATALGFDSSEVVPVSTSGGIFEVPLVRAHFRHGLRAGVRAYELRPSLLSPDAGAALYASQLAGQPLTQKALDALCAHAAPTSQRR